MFSKGFWATTGLLLLTGALCVWLMNPHTVGLLSDDGMYLMAARALAAGHGYRLENIVGQPWLYKYPPLYPLLLVPVLLLPLSFLSGVLVLKILNILMTLAFLALLAAYCRRIRHCSWPLTLGLLALMATNQRLIENATELMSEPLYMLLSMAVLCLAGRTAVQSPSAKAFYGLVLLSVLSVYARTIGLFLMAAVFLWLALSGSWRRALQYAALSALLLLPWFLWTWHAPDQTLSINGFLVRTFQESYFQSFRMDLRYEATLAQLYGRGLNELFGNLSVQMIPLMEWFPQTPAAGFWYWLSCTTSLLLCALLAMRLFQAARQKTTSPVGLYVLLSLLILPFWDFYACYPRFLIPLLPFLWLFVADALRAIPRLPVNAVLPLLFALLLSANVIHLWPYLQKPYADTLLIGSRLDAWSDFNATANYIRTRTPADAVLATDEPDQIYFYALNTQRPTADFFIFLPKSHLPADVQTHWQAILTARAAVIAQMLIRNHVTYYIAHDRAIIISSHRWGTPRLPTISILVQRYPHHFQPVFTSPHGLIRVYRVTGTGKY